MTTWTNAARAALERYLARLRLNLATAGADPAEVTDDLRRHIDRELAERNLKIVTEDEVSRILARIGSPDAGPPYREAPPPPSEEPRAGHRDSDKRSSRPAHPFLLLFGTALPLIALIFEIVARGCAGLLFDPLPTFWHTVLVGLVPAANLFAWWVLRNRRLGLRNRACLATGFAIGISLYYAILFLPVTPFALIGILYLGLGSLPLAPLLSLIAAGVLHAKLRELPAASSARGFWPGFAFAALGLMLVTAPGLATRHWTRLASSDSPSERAQGLNRLRAFGDEETLLRDCYGQTRWSRDSQFSIPFLGRPVPADQARAVFFRVTGRPFNSVPPPQLGLSRGGWDALNDLTWDPDQGTETVGRVKELWLAQSRIDGLIESDAALGYVEWTMEFRNDAAVSREARAQILLPPGGVVSRLTLWVNGEEREAAFAGRSHVKEAYKEVAIRQQRDPVLVTTAGPDRILMQCFPVPPTGGTMKVRIGITAPLVLETLDGGLLRWPCFLERNFSLPEQFSHSIWVESPDALKGEGMVSTPARASGHRHAVHGEMTDAMLAQWGNALRVQRSSDVQVLWSAVDKTEEGETLIRQTFHQGNALKPDRVVLVIDGSRQMRPFFGEIGDALRHLSPEIAVSILYAGDEVEELTSAKSGKPGLSALVERVRELRGKGGQDNVPALLRAWNLAAAAERGVIVWIHGPQPMAFESAERLKQRCEWSQGHPLLYDVQTAAGPNRIVEKLDGSASLRIVPRFRGLNADLQRLFEGWNGGENAFQLVRERVPAPVDTRGGKQATRHLARLWANEEVSRLNAARKIQEAVKLAAQYQLVTAVSGAVVLETQQQYDRAGLEPVDAAGVPVVPEPGTIAVGLLAFIILAIGYSRRRLRRRICRPKL